MYNSIYIRKLTDILTQLEAISPDMNENLESSFQESSHERFDDFLLDEGLVSKEDLLKALSILYQVPYLDVDGYFFQTFLLHKFPEGFLMRNAIIPYEQDQNMLIVVAADPSDPDLLDKIGDHVSYDIRFNVGIYTHIISAIRTYYNESLTEPESYVEQEKEEALSRLPFRTEAEYFKAQDKLTPLDDLPVRQEERDQDELTEEKIKEFVEDETPQEKEEIDKRAHDAEKKK